jgi:hypothetical protein
MSSPSDSSEGGKANDLKTATFDDVLKVVGEFGRYQKLIYLLFSLPYVVTAAQLMGWVFVGARLKHRCKTSPEEPDSANDFFDNESTCSLPGNESARCEIQFPTYVTLIATPASVKKVVTCSR